MRFWKSLWNYWRESAQAAREAHDTAIAWLSIVLTVVGGALKAFGANDLPFKVDDITLYLGISIGIFAMLSLPVRRHQEMEDKLEPRFTVSCGHGVEGSHPAQSVDFNYNVIVDGQVKRVVEVSQWFRLVVHANNRGPIHNARAQLVRISRGSEPLWFGEAVNLTFAPGDRKEAEREEIPDGGSACVDVLVVTRSGRIFMGTLGRYWRFSNMPVEIIFAEKGIYFLDTLVSADNTKSVGRRLKFVWNGGMGSDLCESQ